MPRQVPHWQKRRGGLGSGSAVSARSELVQHGIRSARKLPSEEFRTLRTRLEQLQATRAIQTVLVTSPSPGEGKSFTAANLALAEAQLADNPTLLCDFDLRSPTLHSVFQIDRSPGISDYLLGQGRSSRRHPTNRK